MGDDLATLVRPSTPNSYLVCPRDRCAAAADEEGPVYVVSATALRAGVRDILSAESRVELVGDEVDIFRLVFVQRSRIFRFPDTVTVQIFPLSDGTSALAMYSRSNYGRSDLGVNKARVRRWIGLIDARFAAGKGSAGRGALLAPPPS